MQVLSFLHSNFFSIIVLYVYMEVYFVIYEGPLKSLQIEAQTAASIISCINVKFKMVFVK